MAQVRQPGRSCQVQGRFLASAVSYPPLGAAASRHPHPALRRKRGRAGWGKAAGTPRLPREAEALWVCWFGACTAGISADICSRCAPAGLPNRHIESTSAAANRRTSMRYGSLRRRCSRLTGCRVAACGGFSPHPARSPWWRGRTARSWASPSCCFVLTAGWHASILSRSPRNTQAAGLRQPSSRWQRKSRGGANADPCGLKFTKEITVPLRCIAGPGIMRSAGTITTIRTAATRSGSRSNCRMIDDGRPMTGDRDWKSDIRHPSSDICHQKGTSP
jgi:hypothetical protein